MKRFVSILLALVMLCSFCAGAFAEENAKVIIMELAPDVKRFAYEDGSQLSYALQQDCLAEFHRLRNGNGIYWGELDSGEARFEETADGDVVMTAISWVALDGRKVSTSDPQVVFPDTVDKMHPTGAGEAVVSVCDADGAELAVYNVKVSGTSFRNFDLSVECPKCLEYQSGGVHLMSCGHYSCETGRDGHGNAPCGIVGHFLCGGGDHGICGNCLKPLCKGEHGVGVCPHEHSRAHVRWVVYPTCTTGGLEHIVCPGCGYAAIVHTPNKHTWHPYYSNICVYCHHVRDASDEW